MRRSRRELRHALDGIDADNDRAADWRAYITGRLSFEDYQQRRAQTGQR